MAQGPHREPIELIESADLQEVLRATQLAAWERDYQRIYPLHFLYALMEVENVASIVVRQMLREHCMIIEDLLRDIDKELGRGFDLGQSSELPLSPGAVLAFTHARNIALASGFPEVGCDHLLLGIFHEGGDATKILALVGVREERFKAALTCISKW